jgi:hypothetical protein
MGYKELKQEVNKQEARARDQSGIVGALRAGGTGSGTDLRRVD